MKQDLRKSILTLKQSVASAISEKVEGCKEGSTAPDVFAPLAATLVDEAVALGQKYAELVAAEKATEALAAAEKADAERKAANEARRKEAEAARLAAIAAEAAALKAAKTTVVPQEQVEVVESSEAEETAPAEEKV